MLRVRPRGGLQVATRRLTWRPSRRLTGRPAGHGLRMVPVGAMSAVPPRRQARWWASMAVPAGPRPGGLGWSGSLPPLPAAVVLPAAIVISCVGWWPEPQRWWQEPRIALAGHGCDRLARGEHPLGGVQRTDHPGLADHADDLVGCLLGAVGLDAEHQPVVGVLLQGKMMAGQRPAAGVGQRHRREDVSEEHAAGSGHRVSLVFPW